jgi:hypothetical protein
MHGRELVEQFGVNQLQTGLEQLSANHERQNAANDQHGESKQQVQGTNVFVVGGIDPAAPAVRGTVVVIVTVDVTVGIEDCAHDVFLLNASF